MKLEFEYHLPINLSFGCGKIDTVGEQTIKYGRKAFIVTGGSSTKKTGTLNKIIEKLDESGVGHVIFDQVTPNPVADTVYLGVQIVRENACDVIVALGGGSIIDCAKAIAFAYYNDGDLFDYIYGRRHGNKALPLIAIPTTCGTGSEGNGFAVLTDTRTKDKKSLRNMVCVPKVSIIDPALMTTMPDKVASSVMFDALCHNIEAYISKTSQPLVEIQSMYAIKLLGKYMIKAYNNHTDMDAWRGVTLASTLGGMCINIAGVTAPHGMEHPASGLKDIVHGRGLAALAPVIYKETVSYAPEKFDEISKALGGSCAGNFIEKLDKLIELLDLKTTLSKEGIEEKDIDWMTDNCLKVSAPAMNAHPRTFSKEEIKELYYKAL